MRFLIVCLLLMGLIGTARGDERLYMRVVARDDTVMGQMEKHIVRNMALLLGVQKAKQLEEIYPACTVERKIWQPDNKTPPAETVYITIGPGNGRNWWGVLYPESAAWTAGTDGQGILFPLISWVRGLFSFR